MAWDNSDLKDRRRENLLKLLVLLSDKEKQFHYAQTVGDKVAIDEMVSMWFDDHYHGDKDEFKAMYDEDELKSLKNFNDFYNSIYKKLPDDNIEELNNYTDWIKLRTLALTTIKELKKP